jgi:hypothetical protein
MPPLPNRLDSVLARMHDIARNQDRAPPDTSPDDRARRFALEQAKLPAEDQPRPRPSQWVDVNSFGGRANTLMAKRVPCPTCGQGFLVLRRSYRGEFCGCTTWPTCCYAGPAPAPAPA